MLDVLDDLSVDEEGDLVFKSPEEADFHAVFSWRTNQQNKITDGSCFNEEDEESDSEDSDEDMDLGGSSRRGGRGGCGRNKWVSTHSRMNPVEDMMDAIVEEDETFEQSGVRAWRQQPN